MNIDEIKASLIAELSGASMDVIDKELLYAAVDFLRYTRLWTVKDTVTTANAQSRYGLTTPAGSHAKRIVGVYRSGRQLNPWDGRIGTPVDNGYFSFDFQTQELVLDWAAETSGGEEISVLIACAPDALTALPDSILSEARLALSHGVRSSMMMHANRPYSNPGAAMFYGRAYKAECDRVRRDILTAHANGDMGWSYPLATRSKSLR